MSVIYIMHSKCEQYYIEQILFNLGYVDRQKILPLAPERIRDDFIQS